MSSSFSFDRVKLCDGEQYRSGNYLIDTQLVFFPIPIPEMERRRGCHSARRTTLILFITNDSGLHAEGMYQGTILESHKASDTVMATKMKRRRRDMS